MVRRRRVFAGLAAAILVSCGEHAVIAPAPAADAGLEARREAAAQALATSFCAALAACDQAMFETLPDAQTCTVRMTTEYVQTWFQRGATATPEDVKACAAAFGADCAAYDALTMEGRWPDACHVPAGALPDGAPCLARIAPLAGGQAVWNGAPACASGTCRCDPPGCNPAGLPCGVCGPASAPQGACSVDSDCVPGLGCAAGHCVALRDQGEPCSATAPCHRWLACKTGTCQPLAAAGDPCSYDTDCQRRPEPLYCHPSSRVCVPVVDAKGAATCGWTADSYVQCPPDQGCAYDDPSATAPAGTCRALSEAGSVCRGGFGPRIVAVGCRFPGVCLGACQTLDPAVCDAVPFPPL